MHDEREHRRRHQPTTTGDDDESMPVRQQHQPCIREDSEKLSALPELTTLSYSLALGFPLLSATAFRSARRPPNTAACKGRHERKWLIQHQMVRAHCGISTTRTPLVCCAPLVVCLRGYG